jgi:hypothetical protein
MAVSPSPLNNLTQYGDDDDDEEEESVSDDDDDVDNADTEDSSAPAAPGAPGGGAGGGGTASAGLVHVRAQPVHMIPLAAGGVPAAKRPRTGSPPLASKIPKMD